MLRVKEYEDNECRKKWDSMSIYKLLRQSLDSAPRCISSMGELPLPLPLLDVEKKNVHIMSGGKLITSCSVHQTPFATPLRRKTDP